MGKFRVNVVGNSFRDGVLSYAFNVDSNDKSVIDACIELFKDFWGNDEPYNIETEVTDIDALYQKFRPSDNEKVKQKIEEIKQEKTRQDEKERELLAKLKAKYEQ